MVFLSTVYIAPFIKGTAIVLTDMLGLTVTRGEPEVEGDLFKSYGFTAIVGFTGGWRGRFLLDMSPTTAVALARGFTGEEYQSERKKKSFSVEPNWLISSAVRPLPISTTANPV